MGSKKKKKLLLLLHVCEYIYFQLVTILSSMHNGWTYASQDNLSNPFLVGHDQLLEGQKHSKKCLYYEIIIGIVSF